VSSAPTRGTATAEWTRRRERGSRILIRFIVWFSTVAGRSASRGLLRMCVVYFFATAGAARTAARESLRRCLGRESTLAERFRLFMNFGTVLHDRVFLLEGRNELFDMEVQGAETLGDGGAILLGGHLGSFEAMRAVAAGRRSVAMAMYEDNARKVREALGAVAPRMGEHIVPLGRLDSMLRLEARLAEGALVGILADRTLGDEPCLEIPFLGGTARFPTGPMRIAAALRQRVLFMAGLYRGANRYEIHFEPLVDFAQVPEEDRKQRARLIEEAVARYAACLERHCRAAPDNFFNFYRFWQ